MDIEKIKQTLLKFLKRLLRNSSGKRPLTEGERYIQNKYKGAKNKKVKQFTKKESKFFKEPKPRFFVGFGPGSIGYAIFFIFALIFTQALRSPVSSVLMIFAILWLVFTVIYLIIMIASIDSFVEYNGFDVYKNVVTKFSIKIVNHSIFPVPFAEADLRLPEKNSLRCLRKRIKIAMSPSGDYIVDKHVSFGYRGTYDVGVDSVCVYDLFKIFRINLKMYNYRSIYVMPRRYTLNKRHQMVTSDSQTELQRNIIGIERSDVAEIRTYIPGDAMKNIHWKLSSKSEELQVKNYMMNSGKTVYIFCDVKAHFDPIENASYDIDINEYGVDGAVELAVAVASREMSEGNKCILVWNDERVESGIQEYTCTTNDEFLNVLKMFSTAPIAHDSTSFVELTSLISESQNVSLIFVTDYLDAELVNGVSRAAAIAGSNTSSAEVYFFDPLQKINNEQVKEKQRGYNVRCERALREANILFSSSVAEIDGHMFEQ